MPDDHTIYINGINGETGQYLLPPMGVEDMAALALGEPKNAAKNNWLAAIWHKIKTPFMGLPLGVDPADVTQAGWGIVFLKDEDAAVKAALQPLIEHRKKQIHNDAIVRILDYTPGEKYEAWLGRYGASPGNTIPSKVPYYLLLVGDPAQISFEFGHLLDVEYGVGWLHFDTPAEYAAYASSVIDYENSTSVPNGKEAVFFGTRHPFDQATRMSADYLVNPLADGIPATGSDPATPGVAQQWGYQTKKIWGNDATKANLIDALCQPGDRKPPAFLFTASHGMGFPSGSPQQKASQGALLCQEWPGFGTIGSNHYFSAADVPADARIQGMVIFHFACYGGGTPDHDQFIHDPGQPPAQIAASSFLAALPRTWLTHPGGGALAVIGHVERAWGYSIVGAASTGPQIQTFQNAIGRTLIGQPLGYALKDFSERYAALSTSLSALLQQREWGQKVDQDDLVTNWIERNDAEGYILIGDPAVRLRANDLA